MYCVLSSTTTVLPLSALLIIMFGLFINSFKAFLSFLVKLSCLFCSYYVSSASSSCLIFHGAESSFLWIVICSFNLFVVCFFLNGSLSGFLFSCSSWYFTLFLVLIMNLLISLCSSVFFFLGWE